MSEQRVVSPTSYPEKAAHEAVVALCETGAFGIGNEHKAMGAGDGEALAEAVIAFHKKLTAYYKEL
ncbi:hypothetical protein ACIGG6_03480 [Vreelandella lionensis]|uniref:Uncharacterized protein n=1 Tax=Vreelandella lionensis TaxID=1144478 RepID=A0ABW8BPC7_9GAMM